MCVYVYNMCLSMALNLLFTVLAKAQMALQPWSVAICAQKVEAYGGRNAG